MRGVNRVSKKLSSTIVGAFTFSLLFLFIFYSANTVNADIKTDEEKTVMANSIFKYHNRLINELSDAKIWILWILGE